MSDPRAFLKTAGMTSIVERKVKLEVSYSHSSFTKPIWTYRLPFQAIKRAVFDLKREDRT